jgi:hypothetical protein
MKKWLWWTALGDRRSTPRAEGKRLKRLPEVVPLYAEMRPVLQAELGRSRRYERPLAILAVTLDHPLVFRPHGGASSSRWSNGRSGRPGLLTWPEADWVIARVNLMVLGELLKGNLRECDIVTYSVSSQRYIVALPECDAPAAHRAVDRLVRVLGERTAAAARAGVAAYPLDGLTLEDLVAAAERRLLDAVGSQGLSLVGGASSA